jgi:hypothetical protein
MRYSTATASFWRNFAIPVCIGLVAHALAASVAPACNVPVFRYALEHWKPSPYLVHVFHRGPLAPPQLALLKKLESRPSTNWTLTTIDLAGSPSAPQAALWRLHGNGAALPRVLVQYPEDDEDAAPVWAGPLEEAALRALLDSPARRELVKLLTSGESAVWLLLESGDAKADDAAAQLARRELTRLQTAIQLPVQDEPDRLEARLPLRLSFALLRVSRSDPAESAFVRQLLGSDTGLQTAKGPILFPVFGRGRLLVGLHGVQLRPATIERWASFLCGPCSCQVKELNPGVDLLLTAAWEELLGEEDRPEPPRPAPAIPPGRGSKPAPDEAGPGPRRTGWLWPAVGVGGTVLVLAGLRRLRGNEGDQGPRR